MSPTGLRNMVPRAIIARFIMLQMIVAGSLLASGPAWAERVALVLGNSVYQATPALPNAQNDAADMAQALRNVGFKVFTGQNLDRPGMLDLIQEFAAALRPEDTALLYYAGHGVQLGRENYLIPVDARIGATTDIANTSIKLQSVLRTMELRANARIIILDACRDNPFVVAGASRSGSAPTRGLARIEAGIGSYIAFSTQPGNTASDGDGRNSPFTAALLRHIGTQGADIHAVMRRVRSDVHTATSGTQIPWENSSLVREVFFVPQGGSQGAPSNENRTQALVTRPAEPLRTQPEPDPINRDQGAARYHYVDGLDPQGDNFLALRSQPLGQGRRIARMGPGTLLEVQGQRGNWLKVQTPDGWVGWAHRKWIFCCRTLDGSQSRAPKSEPERESRGNLTGLTCDELWYQRNSIWHRNGYCFGGARGKRTFGNQGCSRDQAQARAAMSRVDSEMVDRVLRQEQAQGCR